MYSCILQHQQQGQLISTAPQQHSGLSPLLVYMRQAYKVVIHMVLLLQNVTRTDRQTDRHQASKTSILDGVLESKPDREAGHPVSLPLCPVEVRHSTSDCHIPTQTEM